VRGMVDGACRIPIIPLPQVGSGYAAAAWKTNRRRSRAASCRRDAGSSLKTRVAL